MSRHLYLVADPASDEWAKKARPEVERFFEANPTAQVVSFENVVSDAFLGRPVVSWRSFLSQSEDYALWEEGYKRILRLAGEVEPYGAELLHTYLHECAFDFYLLLVLEKVASSESSFLIVLSTPIQESLAAGIAGAIDESGLEESIFAVVVEHAFRNALVRTTVGFVKVLALSLWLDGRARRYKRSFKRIWQTANFRRLLRKTAVYVARGALFPFAFGFKALTGLAKSQSIKVARIVRKDVVVVSVDDSGTMVNLRPALKVLAELKSRGQAVVAISSYPSVAQAISESGIKAIVVPPTSFTFRHLRAAVKLRAELSRLIVREEVDSTLKAYLSIFARKSPGYLRAVSATNDALDALATNVRVKGALTIYEALPLSKCVGRWVAKRKLPWIGFFPILLGNRPDCRDYPATHHLAYGDQLKDLMLKEGCSESSIHVVGTPTFEGCLGRNRETDRALVLQACRGAVEKKLVVVSTEAFAQPLIELEPIFRALAEMDDVQVIVKVHPADSLDFYVRTAVSFQGRQQFLVVKDFHLCELLNAADLLLSIVSNIIVIAAMMGTPNLVCDFSGKTSSVDFVAEGLSRGCYDPREIASMVRRSLFDADFRKASIAMLDRGIRRFNGPGDGKSHVRVADFILSASP